MCVLRRKEPEGGGGGGEGARLCIGGHHLLFAAAPIQIVEKWDCDSPRVPCGATILVHKVLSVRQLCGHACGLDEACTHCCACSFSSLSGRSIQLFFCFRLGANTLPVEMGRRLHMARDAPLYPMCPGMLLGQRHNVIKRPVGEDIRGRHSRLFDDSHAPDVPLHVAFR